MPNFNSIGSGVSEPQVAENRYLPLTGGIALTTVYALTCYTVMYAICTVCPKTNAVKSWVKCTISRHPVYGCSQKYFSILRVDKRQCLTPCHYSWRFSAKYSQGLRRIDGRCTDPLACSSINYIVYTSTIQTNVIKYHQSQQYTSQSTGYTLYIK